MLFVAIISWKGISRFNGGAGGASFLSWGVGSTLWGASVLMGGFSKKIVEFALAFQKH